MSYEAQELCMRRDYFQIISGEGMGMGDILFILLEKQSGMTCGVHFLEGCFKAISVYFVHLGIIIYREI